MWWMASFFWRRPWWRVDGWAGGMRYVSVLDSNPYMLGRPVFFSCLNHSSVCNGLLTSKSGRVSYMWVCACEYTKESKCVCVCVCVCVCAHAYVSSPKESGLLLLSSQCVLMEMNGQGAGMSRGPPLHWSLLTAAHTLLLHHPITAPLGVRGKREETGEGRREGGTEKKVMHLGEKGREMVKKGKTERI